MSSLFAGAIDRHFGIHATALEFRSARSQVLASNLTNADTPNFKARDLDFAEVLKAESGSLMPASVRMARTHQRHIAVGGSDPDAGPLLYRNPFQPTLDGNTVESEVEQGKFAENAVQYQTSLMFLTRKIRGLQLAIKGQA
ncbi:MAG: flagellar basal body rod protein FlgB [Pseudomonadota bacterium]